MKTHTVPFLIFITVFCLAASHQSAAEGLYTSNPQQDQPSSPPSSWPGHLKPLASQSIRHPVPVIHKFPSPFDFFREYVYPAVPVVFRGGARRSPAFRKWTDEYLKSLPESQELIDFEMRKVEERELPRMRMPFAEFLDRYKVHDEYLVTGVPDFLKKDVLIPPPLHCTNITSNLVDTVLWFSSGGTKSHVHTDYVDNINCLFRGQKVFLFVNYTRYRHQIVFDHPEGFYSSVDVERVDFNKFPWLRDVEFLEAKLEAGDRLYVPFKWIHQVNSYGSNIAVNIWWNHQAYIVPTPESCGRPDPGLSLADVGFHYHDQTNADRQVELHPELDFVKNPAATLSTFMEEEETPSLTVEHFLEFLDMMMPSGLGHHDYVWTEEALDLAHQIFKLLDRDSSGELTLQDMKRFPTQVNQLEPFSIHLGKMMMILGDVIDGRITKQKQEILKLREDEKLQEGSNMPLHEHPSESMGASEHSPTRKKEEL